MMLVCIKQYLSNIWSSIHEKVKQLWGWVEKKKNVAYKKGVYTWVLYNFQIIVNSEDNISMSSNIGQRRSKWSQNILMFMKPSLSSEWNLQSLLSMFFFFLNKINVRLAQPQSINIFFVYKVESDWQAAIARVSMPQYGYVTLHL